MNLHFGNAVLQRAHKLLGKKVGVVGDYFEFVAVFDTAQAVIHNDIGDEKVEQSTEAEASESKIKKTDSESDEENLKKITDMFNDIRE